MKAIQRALRDYMSELSEKYYSAEWSNGLEYQLYAVLAGDHRAFAGGALTDDEVQDLRDLGAACMGWIYWDGDVLRNGCTVFIPLKEWQIKYVTYKLKGVVVQTELTDHELETMRGGSYLSASRMQEVARTIDVLSSIVETSVAVITANGDDLKFAVTLIERLLPGDGDADPGLRHNAVEFLKAHPFPGSYEAQRLEQMKKEKT